MPTSEEARIYGKKGGVASGEARRRRKTLKEELLLLLSDGDVQQKVATALINEAINGNSAGSVTRAFEVLRDTIGEDPSKGTDAVAEAEAVIIVAREQVVRPDE